MLEWSCANTYHSIIKFSSLTIDIIYAVYIFLRHECMNVFNKEVNRESGECGFNKFQVITGMKRSKWNCFRECRNDMED